MADKTVTIQSSGGDYTSLNAAFAGEATANHDLVAGLDGILTFECWNFEDTTTATTGTGFDTDASHYLDIIGRAADKTASNTGKWSTDRYRLNGTGATQLAILESYTKVSDLQIATSGNYGVVSQVTSAWFVNCIVKGCARDGFLLTGVSVTTRLINCLAYDCTRSGFVVSDDGGNDEQALNCTAVDCARNGFEVAARTLKCTNCLSYHCGDNATYFDFKQTVGTLVLTHCASMDNSGTADLRGISDPFTNYAADDFHLAVGSAMINAGDDMSGTYAYDVDGAVVGARDDIGFDEYVAAGGSSILPQILSLRRRFSN